MIMKQGGGVISDYVVCEDSKPLAYFSHNPNDGLDVMFKKAHEAIMSYAQYVPEIKVSRDGYLQWKQDLEASRRRDP